MIHPFFYDMFNLSIQILLNFFSTIYTPNLYTYAQPNL